MMVFLDHNRAVPPITNHRCPLQCTHGNNAHILLRFHLSTDSQCSLRIVSLTFLPAPPHPSAPELPEYVRAALERRLGPFIQFLMTWLTAIFDVEIKWNCSVSVIVVFLSLAVIMLVACIYVCVITTVAKPHDAQSIRFQSQGVHSYLTIHPPWGTSPRITTKLYQQQLQWRDLLSWLSRFSWFCSWS